MECIPGSGGGDYRDTSIPTMIGAGPHCDGQVLVFNDVMGLFDKFVPKFVKQYAKLMKLLLPALKSIERRFSRIFPMRTIFRVGKG